MGKPGPKLSCMLPSGPVMTPGARFARFGVSVPSGANYSANAALPLAHPVVPLLPFGLTYELDLIFMTQHPSWNMHEYALIKTSAGLLWLAKDAREGTMEQTIIAGVEDIDDWMPEVPVQRRHQAFDVVEAIGPDEVELSFDYVNWDGERTEVHYQGRFPRTARPKRNGSTMGHSAGQLMALLDLSHQDLARRGSVSIGGVLQKPARIFGIPVRAALRQTQGGLVTGTWTQRDEGQGFATDIVARSGRVLPRAWEVTERPASRVQGRDGDAAVFAVQADADRELGARFRRDGERLELDQLWAWQRGQSAAGYAMEFSPPLPDLRTPFAGEVISHWVADVAGQRSHAVGTVVARWTDDGPQVDLRPAEPWWVWDRPMRSSLRAVDAGVEVVVQRVPTAGEPPSHGRCVAALSKGNVSAVE